MCTGRSNYNLRRASALDISHGWHTSCLTAGMSRELVPRLNGSVYVGRRCYFLTVWTFHRTHASHTDPIVEGVLMALRQCAADYQFAVHAYCFMPDHVYLLLEGLSNSSDLRRFIRDWKQRTTYEYRNTTGGDLWQREHVDHVLRPDEDLDFVMRYVLSAPVRVGLPPPRGSTGT